MDRKTFRQRRDFLLELGKALHKFGTTAARLESHMLNVCRSLGMDGYFIVSPTMITVVLWIPGIDKRHNYHVRVSPGELDLGSLAKADALVDRVISNDISISEAAQSLNKLLSAKPPYSRWATLVAYGFSSAAFATLIGQNWAEVLVSFLAGMVVYSMVWLVETRFSSAEALDPLVALAAALFAGATQMWFPEINAPLVVLSGIIVFIPGLSITMALKDLAARHLISGTGRLMDSLLCLCKLYFGSAFGKAIVGLFWTAPIVEPVINLPDWADWLAIPSLSFALMIIFKNRLSDAPWGLVCCFLAYGGTLFGNHYIGDNLGPFLGALLIGVYSNIWSRVTNTSSLVILLSGVVLLVPGSKAFMGLDQVVQGGSFMALPQIGVQSFMMFMSIMAGLIFANAILPSRKLL